MTGIRDSRRRPLLLEARAAPNRQLTRRPQNCARVERPCIVMPKVSQITPASPIATTRPKRVQIGVRDHTLFRQLAILSIMSNRSFPWPRLNSLSPLHSTLQPVEKVVSGNPFTPNPHERHDEKSKPERTTGHSHSPNNSRPAVGKRNEQVGRGQRGRYVSSLPRWE